MDATNVSKIVQAVNVQTVAQHASLNSQNSLTNNVFAQMENINLAWNVYPVPLLAKLAQLLETKVVYHA